MTTLELGRTKTWRFPRRSALVIPFNASFRTLTRTMVQRRKRSCEKFQGQGRRFAIRKSNFPTRAANRFWVVESPSPVALLISS
jgi:hypothetical protein